MQAHCGGHRQGGGTSEQRLQSPTASSSSGTGDRQDCAGCQKPISERYLLRALDRYWHEDCLKCSCCDCRLGEVGSTLYTKANLLLCRRDYLRLFGPTGHCSACSKMIPAFEMVMRAKDNVYHLECFACQQCNHRFCIGDHYYLCDNKILCQFDYEERLVLARLSSSYSSLTQMKKLQATAASASATSLAPEAATSLSTGASSSLATGH